MKRKGLSLLLALSMVFALAPTAALADSGAADPITVYVTISNQGGVPVGKNNTLMAKVPVTATDLDKNGSISYDEAMTATHKEYYEGSDAGYKAANNWCSELWGETKGVGSFYRNNTALSNGVNTDTVADGDYLMAFVYADQSTWSDAYSYFDQTSVSAETGESVPLTLKQTSWGQSATAVAGASLATLDEKGGFVDLNQTTDSNGSVTLSFDKAGTYVVSAYSNNEDEIIAPPVCVVIVAKAGSRESGVRTAVSNCVSGYQGTTCGYKDEWVMLSRLRALSGADGWTTKDADVKAYVESVEAAVKSGDLSKDTVPTTIERVILTLTAAGMDPTHFCGEDLTAWLYDNENGIGDYAINDLIWALIALDSGNYTTPDGYRDSIVTDMKAYQNADGGFFYSKSYNTSDVDMTEMALVALNSYGKSNAEAQQMSEAGKSFLEAKRNANGNYSNSCTDAYGVIAMSTLNQSGTALHTLVSTMLSNYLDEKGFTYNGTLNGMATYQGLLAMDAYQRLTAGKNAVFDLTDAEKKVISVEKPSITGSYTYSAGKQTVKIPASWFYTVSGTTSATKVGSYTVTVSLNDKTNTTWSDGSTADLTLSWDIGKQVVSKLTYSAVTSQSYTGNTQKPAVTVKNGSKKLTAGTDYTIAYSGNQNIGTGKIIIVGKGNYTGTKTIQFKIVPKKVTLSSVKNAKGKKLTVKWTKNTTVTGYRVYYSTSKSFKSYKVVTVKGSKNTAMTLTKLTKNKWYYVRVRGYKSVSGSNYYSNWSNVKADKIKK